MSTKAIADALAGKPDGDLRRIAIRVGVPTRTLHRIIEGTEPVGWLRRALVRQLGIKAPNTDVDA